MAKTYILEPIELEFTDGNAITESVLLSDEDISAIPSNAIASVGDETFKLSIISEDSEIFHEAIFTPNGEEYDEDAYEGVSFTIYKDPLESGNSIVRFNSLLDEQLTGTYTVSIYTETDDPEPEPEPSVDLTPVTREEHYLSAIAGLSELPEGMVPITREEIFLQAILDKVGK